MQEIFMRRAIELAKNGMGYTSPNPCVGAVIVKGGVIVAEGFHEIAGAEHAEIVAIREMMKKSNIVTVDLEPRLFHNATLYVTLEPCRHHGKVGPCVRSIVQAGFQKVCIGMRDPFKKVNGRGIKYLKAHGIQVEVCRPGSLIAAEIRSLNQPFIKWAELGLPYVILKSGMSLDGKIATDTGESKWITSDDARADARFCRSQCDAVLIGAGTVAADDPELHVVTKFKKKNLFRVVVDRKLSLSLSRRIFKNPDHVFVASTDLASKGRQKLFRDSGVEFKSFGKNKVSMKRLFKFLSKRNIQSVFVEGGSSINGALIDEALKDRYLIDKVLFYVAPKFIGGEKSLSVIGGKGASKLSKCITFKSLDFVKKFDEDLKLEAVLNVY